MSYKVVVFMHEGEEIEVEAKNYETCRAPELCVACNQPLAAAPDPARASERAGREFGEMLKRRGALTFRQALFEVLLTDRSVVAHRL